MTGCVPMPAEPAATPSPSASAGAPVVFASSSDEALALAREIYANFLDSTDAALASRGSEPERITEFASAEVASEELEGVEEFRTNGYQLVGQAQITNVILESHGGNAQNVLPPVTLYVCVNVAHVDVLDRDGNSVVKPSRPDATAFEVTLDDRPDHGAELIVVSKSVWSGGGVC
jgi:hypothetical protein